MTSIGKNIKQIRIKNNMTQEELAAALFVTRQTISNYETGKSNPDIDTIIKIAELFEVDANTVIYGLPLDAHQKRNRSWAISTGIFLVVLFIADFLLHTFFEQYNDYYLFPPPVNILKFSLFPLTFFVCGFYAMHIIGLFTPIKPFNNLAAKITRIIVFIIILVFAVGTLYYAAFSICTFLEHYLNLNIHFRWYGFYKLRYFITINTKYPFIFTILGALSWLFGLIYRQEN
ncbi:MAG: helix-turn-helix transcriptional regulator [Clostridia bacterium]|nr:helix-turn-helix transcriptional regulator [Clostridia bacterium]